MGSMVAACKTSVFGDILQKLDFIFNSNPWQPSSAVIPASCLGDDAKS
jgi:hypothetical protein